MAWAICDQCKTEVSWKAGRGARLKDLKCPTCGGQLRSKAAGRTMEKGRGPSRRCVICGKLRFTGIFTVPEDGVCKRWGGASSQIEGGEHVVSGPGFVDVPVKAGDIICWTGHYYDKGGAAQDTAVPGGNISEKGVSDGIQKE